MLKYKPPGLQLDERTTNQLFSSTHSTLLNTNILSILLRSTQMYRNMKQANVSTVKKALAQIIMDTVKYEQKDIVEEINSEAVSQYGKVKIAKQREMSGGVEEGRIGKERKKQIDNHASAVASRQKTKFLKRKYPAELRRMSRNSVALMYYIRHLNQEIASMQNTVSSCKEVVHRQRREIDNLRIKKEPAGLLSPDCVINSADLFSTCTDFTPLGLDAAEFHEPQLHDSIYGEASSVDFFSPHQARDE